MLFMPTVVVLYFMFGLTARRWLLLAASYYFYCVWSAQLASLLVFSTVLDYTVARLMATTEDPRRRKWLVGLSLAGNLGMLGLFKYLGFFTEIANSLVTVLGMHEVTVHRLVLPMGISFYTFQTLSYTIDVYRRKIPATTSPVDFAIYIAFFPQLVAGPIVRAADFLPQLRQRIRLFCDQPTFFLILRGLAKKVIIADNVALLPDAVFAQPENFPSLVIWLAAICFAVQIYCDFSGYSDIAIGVARVLGFRIPLNFDHPYFSRNPSEFWRRWHISLSSWLRDYLYIPLRRNRVGAART